MKTIYLCLFEGLSIASADVIIKEHMKELRMCTCGKTSMHTSVFPLYLNDS